MPGQTFVPHVFFGLDPMLVSTAILLVTYGVIIWTSSTGRSWRCSARH